MSWADAIQNNILRVECAMLVVQFLAFVGLLFYVRYTRALKKSAERQVKLSEDLLRAALEQVEGAARPCVTLASRLRDREDTISELYGVKGASVVKDYKGFLALRNIGNGLALNVSYRFDEADPNRGKDLKGNRGYLQRLHAEKEIRLPLPISMTARGEWDVTFEFESLGSRRYRTTLLLQANVLSNFKFEQLSNAPHLISADIPSVTSGQGR